MRAQREEVYFIRIEEARTGETLYEDFSTFPSTREALQDAEYLIEEGFVPLAEFGYIVRVYDTHPDVPGARQLASRGIHIKPEGGG